MSDSRHNKEEKTSSVVKASNIPERLSTAQIDKTLSSSSDSQEELLEKLAKSQPQADKEIEYASAAAKTSPLPPEQVQIIEADYPKLLTQANRCVSEAQQELDSARAELEKVRENHNKRMERDDQNYKEKRETLVKLTLELDKISGDRDNLLSPPDEDGYRLLPTDEAKLQEYYDLDGRWWELTDELIPATQAEVDAILELELEQQGDIIAAKNIIADAQKNLLAAENNLDGVRTVNTKLSEKNKLLVLDEMKHLSLAGKVEHLGSAKDNLLKMHEIGLLDASNIGSIIHGKSVDKSSPVGLTGIGLDKLNKNDVQNRWGWSCVAIEAHISSELQKPDVKLKDLFVYASNKRQKIAKMEHVEAADEFGSPRKTPGQDWYSSREGKSVANRVIFPSLVGLIDMQTENGSIQFSSTQVSILYALKISKDSDANYKECHIGNISSINTCALPDIKLGIVVDKASKIEFISTTVDVIKDLDVRLNALGEHYLPVLKNKNISQDELLKNLGELVFHMARLYPLKRGSGAVIECIARGILKNHYPDIEFSNLKLGKKSDIPYDICAHFIQDPKLYANIFADSVAKKINEERFKPVSVELGAITTQDEKEKTKISGTNQVSQEQPMRQEAENIESNTNKNGPKFR